MDKRHKCNLQGCGSKMFSVVLRGDGKMEVACNKCGTVMLGFKPRQNEAVTEAVKRSLPKMPGQDTEVNL